jgi:hypothetical protein
MNMKRRFLLVLAAGLILAASAFAGGQGEGTPKAMSDSIVVGCLEPLTGAHAIFGTEAKVGMEIAFPADPLNPDNLRQAFLKLDLASGPAVDTAGTSPPGRA